MLVKASIDNCGNIEVRPVSDRWAKKFARAVAANGGPSFRNQERNDFTVFLQQGMGAEEFKENCTPAQRRDLDGGWSITFRANSFYVGNLYGYDACNVT